MRFTDQGVGGGGIGACAVQLVEGVEVGENRLDGWFRGKNAASPPVSARPLGGSVKAEGIVNEADRRKYTGARHIISSR